MNDLLSESFAARDVEMGTPEINKPDYGLQHFYKKVQEVEKLMDNLSKQLKKLEEANKETKAVTKASAMKALKKRMEKDVDEVGKIARTIKMKLEEVDRDNLSSRQKPGCEKGTAVDRSRMAMTVSLKKKLKDRMNDFQNLRQTIQDEYREVVERRVFTVTGTKPSEEMIDDLFNNLPNQTLPLSFFQVTNAVNHIQSGTEALQQAKSLQKKSRKCMMIAISLFLIIAIIIVLSILNFIHVIQIRI